jgi:hypothetical protein
MEKGTRSKIEGLPYCSSLPAHPVKQDYEPFYGINPT